MASIGQTTDAAALVAKEILDGVTHELVEKFFIGSFFQTPDLENFSFSVPSLKYGGFQSSTQKHLTSRTARRSRQFMGIFVLIGLIDSLIAAKI